MASSSSSASSRPPSLIVKSPEAGGSAKRFRPESAEEEQESLKRLRGQHKTLPPPTDRPVRVYCDGIYDMFHFGHARSLMQAKQLFPNTYLIVGVCGDEITHRLKGRTVMNQVERYESVKHCKWVDEVYPDAPWVVTQEFIDRLQIDYVAHGEDLSLDEHGNDVYQFVKDQGRFAVIKRTDGISTSDLILRIVRDYDSYVRRNLARGYDRKELNIGIINAQRLKLESKLLNLKDKVQDGVRKLQDKVKAVDLQSWRQLKTFFLTDFLAHFDPDDEVQVDLAQPSMFSDDEDEPSPLSSSLTYSPTTSPQSPQSPSSHTTLLDSLLNPRS